MQLLKLCSWGVPLIFLGRLLFFYGTTSSSGPLVEHEEIQGLVAFNVQLYIKGEKGVRYHLCAEKLSQSSFSEPLILCNVNVDLGQAKSFLNAHMAHVASEKKAVFWQVQGEWQGTKFEAEEMEIDSKASLLQCRGGVRTIVFI